MIQSALLEYWEVKWGITQCRGRVRCGKIAELLYDGQPLCIDCADLLLQRQLVPRHIADMLPALWEG